MPPIDPGDWISLCAILVFCSAHWPWLAVLGVALLAETFAAYWAHRITHQTPLLWRLHRVHHADNAVDLSTSFRNHPLELIITLPVSAVVVLIVGMPQSVVVATSTWLACADFRNEESAS